MIFVDSSVPMYLIGAPHPNKDGTIIFSFDRAFDTLEELERLS